MATAGESLLAAGRNAAETFVWRAAEPLLRRFLADGRSLTREQLRLSGLSAELTGLELNTDELHSLLALPACLSIRSATVTSLKLTLPGITTVSTAPWVLSLGALSVEVVEEAPGAVPQRQAAAVLPADSFGLEALADGLTVLVDRLSLTLQLLGAVTWRAPALKVCARALVLVTTDAAGRVTDLTATARFNASLAAAAGDSVLTYLFRRLSWGELSVALVPPGALPMPLLQRVEGTAILTSAKSGPHVAALEVHISLSEAALPELSHAAFATVVRLGAALRGSAARPDFWAPPPPPPVSPTLAAFPSTPRSPPASAFPGPPPPPLRLLLRLALPRLALRIRSPCGSAVQLEVWLRGLRCVCVAGGPDAPSAVTLKLEADALLVRDPSAPGGALDLLRPAAAGDDDDPPPPPPLFASDAMLRPVYPAAAAAAAAAGAEQQAPPFVALYLYSCSPEPAPPAIATACHLHLGRATAQLESQAMQRLTVLMAAAAAAAASPPATPLPAAAPCRSRLEVHASHLVLHVAGPERLRLLLRGAALAIDPGAPLRALSLGPGAALAAASAQGLRLALRVAAAELVSEEFAPVSLLSAEAARLELVAVPPWGDAPTLLGCAITAGTVRAHGGSRAALRSLVALSAPEEGTIPLHDVSSAPLSPLLAAAAAAARYALALRDGAPPPPLIGHLLVALTCCELALSDGSGGQGRTVLEGLRLEARAGGATQTGLVSLEAIMDGATVDVEATPGAPARRLLGSRSAVPATPPPTPAVTAAAIADAAAAAPSDARHVAAMLCVTANLARSAVLEAIPLDLALQVRLNGASLALGSDGLLPLLASLSPTAAASAVSDGHLAAAADALQAAMAKAAVTALVEATNCRLLLLSSTDAGASLALALHRLRATRRPVPGAASGAGGGVRLSLRGLRLLAGADCSDEEEPQREASPPPTPLPVLPLGQDPPELCLAVPASSPTLTADSPSQCALLEVPLDAAEDSEALEHASPPEPAAPRPAGVRSLWELLEADSEEALVVEEAPMTARGPIRVLPRETSKAPISTPHMPAPPPLPPPAPLHAPLPPVAVPRTPVRLSRPRRGAEATGLCASLAVQQDAPGRPWGLRSLRVGDAAAPALRLRGAQLSSLAAATGAEAGALAALMVQFPAAAPLIAPLMEALAAAAPGLGTAVCEAAALGTPGDASSEEEGPSDDSHAAAQRRAELDALAAAVQDARTAANSVLAAPLAQPQLHLLPARGAVFLGRTEPRPSPTSAPVWRWEGRHLLVSWRTAVWLARAGPGAVIQLPEGTTALPLDPAAVGGQLHAFAIRLPDKQLVLAVATAEARARWLDALQAATFSAPAVEHGEVAALSSALDRAAALIESLE